MIRAEVIAGGLAFLAAVWLISLWRHPFTTCRRCGGTGRNAGSTGRSYGRCPRCKGKPERLKYGARMVRRRSGWGK